MIKYMVIGDPVAHSRSPAMQNAAFEFCGMGRPYGIRRVPPAELPDFFAYARKHLLGVNLTIPHKQAALPLCDEVTERAEACGSVNTLCIREGKITGDSTDGPGAEAALKTLFGISVSGERVLFIGAGGAARAVGIHFAGRGAKRIVFANRTLSRAEELRTALLAAFPETECRTVLLSDRAALQEALENSTLLIQATSVGLKPEDGTPFDPALLHRGMKLNLFDTIYRETALQKRAAELGIPAAGGKEMLIRQGAASFTLWTGQEAPIEAMRRGFDETFSEGKGSC